MASIPELLDGHVTLEVECLYRVDAQLDELICEAFPRMKAA